MLSDRIRILLFNVVFLQRHFLFVYEKGNLYYNTFKLSQRVNGWCGR